MKTLLISQRDPFLDSDRVMPPLGVMSIKGALDIVKAPCEIENDFKFDGRYTDIGMFGVSCMTPEYPSARQLLKYIKETYPESHCVIGGPHTRFYSVDDPWDEVFVGDFVTTEILPYRDPEFLQQYCFPIRGHRATTIMTAKGCPMNCAFCEDAGSEVVLHSPRFIGKQIEQCKEAGFEAIMFFDDIFAMNEKRVRELTEEIRKHKIVYRCFGHAKTMTPKMADMLAESGCIEIGVGVESGSQKILDTINKKTTVEQNKRFVEICNARDIRVKAFMITGLPGEDEKTLQESEQFLQYLTQTGFNDFDMTLFYPYRGTHIRENLDKYDIQLLDKETLGVYKGKDGTSDAIVRTTALTTEELQEAQRHLLTTYKRYVK